MLRGRKGDEQNGEMFYFYFWLYSAKGKWTEIPNFMSHCKKEWLAFTLRVLGEVSQRQTGKEFMHFHFDLPFIEWCPSLMVGWTKPLIYMKWILPGCRNTVPNIILCVFLVLLVWGSDITVCARDLTLRLEIGKQ